MSESSQRRPEQATSVLQTQTDGGLELRRVVVRVVVGPDRGAERLLEAGTLLLGSHPDNDLPLADDTVSRYHAELALLPEGVRVRDLGSRNGTWLGETRIDSALVTPGAELRLGGTRLQIVAADLATEPPPSDRRSFGGLWGKSLAMRQVFAVLERVAPTSSSVLFVGDSGTGKTTAARAVHDASNRADHPLVVLDAPADTDVSSLVARAAGGALLIERVEGLQGAAAAALLGALEARERGALDVRFLATTAEDLQAMVEAGRFRRELYFHLASVVVTLPPLAAHKDDIPLLLRCFATDAGLPGDVLDKDALAALYAHSWPGNVRELRQLVSSGLDLRGRLAELDAADATAEPAAALSSILGLPFKEAKSELVGRFERAYLVELLRRHGGNVSQAALEAGIDRNYVARLVRRHGIRT